jgi:hypothetical protein
VTWEGVVPTAHETVVRVSAFNPHLHKKPARYQTPHVPLVHPGNAGVANAVVYLKCVDANRSKPWHHLPVRIAFQNRELVVEQGKLRSSIGFARRGERVDIVNRDDEYHKLHARGEAFFSMPLVEANKTHARPFGQAGLVDFTCSAGYYWLHAHLFVADHPYFTRTDADGSFVLDQVPTGTYDIVCWLPSWHVERAERDPEIGVIARFVWQAPKEQSRTIQVDPGRSFAVSWMWNSTMFPAPTNKN